MFCKNCGQECQDDSLYCPKCGSKLNDSTTYKVNNYTQSNIANKPPTYLAQAILATIFCCLPFGIVAIVYAAQVDSKWTIGDYSGAKRASENAKTWCIISLIVGLVIAFIYFFIGIIFEAI